MKRFALIGNGRWGQTYLKTIEKMDDCMISQVRTYDYKQIKNVDGIIIATPANTHAEIINFFQDIPLLVEKPVVTKLEDLDFVNRQVMVGYTYLYNSQFTALASEMIRDVTFILNNNSDYNSDTTMLWELGSHGVALGIFLFGEPTKIKSGYMANGNIRITIDFTFSRLDYQFGWNSENKERRLFVDGEEERLIELKPSPLENEIKSFINFIDTGKTLTGLDLARRVTILLSQVEKNLYEQNNHSYPVL